MGKEEASDLTEYQSGEGDQALSKDYARLFKQDWLESLSHVHPLLPHIIYLPVVGFMLYLADKEKIELSLAISLFVAGLFAWTFTEYMFHRYFFHFRPRNSWQHRVWYLAHGVHHDYPEDARRLVLSPFVSGPIAILFYLLFRTLFGALHPPFFAGFVLGYITYDSLHYLVHSTKPSGGLGLFLKRQHMKHHFVEPDKNFGVSSPLWDHVFRTFSRKQSKKADSVSSS